MKPTILVVDDTEANRYVLCRCLRQAGYVVIEAASGMEALSQMATRPDLVVLDIQLPDFDGYEVCRRIKSDPATRNTLVLNISASFISRQARVTGLDNGADSYLIQPLESSELIATVNSLLRLRDAERVAVRREARYQALVEASSQAVWTLDAEGGVTGEQSLGEMLGRPTARTASHAWLDCFHADDIPRLSQSWTTALASLQPWQEQARVPLAHGGVRHLLLRLVPWRESPEGPVLEWIGLANDMTERVEAEIGLARKVEELARSNQYLEHFAHVLSHDLQEPLRTITNYLDLIRQRTGVEVNEREARYFSYVIEAAKRMRQLITGVLEYSTVTRTPQRRPLRLNEALDEALANLAPQIEAKGARIQVDPLPVAEADRTQIVQLFQNLVANSLKYCADRAPEVRVTTSTKDDLLQVAVSDNGIGMEPQHLEQVFELFRRLHSHERYEGTGIGLALCRRIVEHHGGTIWATSVPGQGSTFTFTLPIAAA